MPTIGELANKLEQARREQSLTEATGLLIEAVSLCGEMISNVIHDVAREAGRTSDQMVDLQSRWRRLDQDLHNHERMYHDTTAMAEALAELVNAAENVLASDWSKPQHPDDMDILEGAVEDARATLGTQREDE